MWPVQNGPRGVEVMVMEWQKELEQSWSSPKDCNVEMWKTREKIAKVTPQWIWSNFVDTCCPVHPEGKKESGWLCEIWRSSWMIWAYSCPSSYVSVCLDRVYTPGTASPLSLMPIWSSNLKCMNHCLLLWWMWELGHSARLSPVREEKKRRLHLSSTLSLDVLHILI